MDFANRDNTFWLSLIIFGELPSKEEIERLLGTPLERLRRKDPTSRGRLAHADVAVLYLAKWNGDGKSREVLTGVIPTLRNWIALFNQLRTAYQISFRISLSAFRQTDQGGIEFPDDFLRVLVEAEVSFGVSIQARFLWEDEVSAWLL